jgi:cell division protein ZapA (FtsZ GTPase activity inhibitor)
MAGAEKQRDETLKSLAKDYQDAMDAVNADLTDALKTAYDDMVAAQDDAKAALKDALDSIQKEFDDKLGKIKNATNSTTAAINAMVAALNAARTLAAMPMPTPAVDNANTRENRVDTTTLEGINKASGISITQHITNTTPDASATLGATVSAIKFGGVGIMGIF